MKILKQLHRVWFMLLVFIFFLLFFPFYYLSSRNERFYPVLNFFRRLHSFLASALAGIFYVYHVEQRLPAGATYIYCANHTSNLDIMVFCILAKGSYHFMGKEELLKNPILRLFFKTIDITVNRDSKISSFRAFKKAGENLDKGMSLVIFPEGKIDDQYPPRLHSFKNGPFRLAIDKNIPIVPVSIADIWKVLWDDGSRLGSRPGRCRIFVHAPVSVTGLSLADDEQLRDHVFEKIKSKLTDQ
ncbi:1-acyl-sn-glycerol-3-phosphate acyltransferase [Pedobacter yulinensis]|uniref:1-acyl-sn-glycerol-3-phosphate acyltransferase n=1 Tax=Pedobacter yulinensis TaxID=2126353 RepID=A0A2T3HMZ4_9SPHI|nr:lysophospholipid acyltransferase family protein [Pedobacter yulinensis]PST83832.1 1-acyl-sn-glycerol-3-phosphate acyltransferase [Pedobacter yulinensis]